LTWTLHGSSKVGDYAPNDASLNERLIVMMMMVVVLVVVVIMMMMFGASFHKI
jgi:heme/copper-type cytochrome/quinol oxidase subunit 2